MMWLWLLLLASLVTSTGPLEGKKIVIDPGHGGSCDKGSFSGSIEERFVTLGVSLKLENALKEKGAQVFLTRRNDATYTNGEQLCQGSEGVLAPRVRIANEKNPNVFLSIHVNCNRDLALKEHKEQGLYPELPGVSPNDPRICASGVLYAEGSTTSIQIAKELALTLGTQAYPDGSESVFFNTVVAGRKGRGGNVYMLRQTSSPAVLVEMGGITGGFESPSSQNTVVMRLVRGLENALAPSKTSEPSKNTEDSSTSRSSSSSSAYSTAASTPSRTIQSRSETSASLGSCGPNEVCIHVGLTPAKLPQTPTPSKPSPSTTISRSEFICPVKGTIRSGVNPARPDPLDPSRVRPHKGVDLAVDEGTPVKAAANGVVTLREFEADGYGNYIIIEHSQNPKIETLYAHLSQVSVRAGDRVKQGDTIAYSGNTGRSTGPHLHFELWKDNQYLSEVEEICKGSARNFYDVSSKTQFQTSNVVLASVADCARQTEAACPSTGTNSFNGRSWKTVSDPSCIFKKASLLFQVPYSLLRAVLAQESAGRQFAVSHAGASGYTQLMPGTAAGMGIGPDKLFDPYYNICGGVHYLARQLKNIGSVECALAAYNAGPGAVIGSTPPRCIPPNPETQRYVPSIMEMWGNNIALG